MIQWIKETLYYDTIKVVTIKSWKLGLLHYSIMFLVLFYVLVYNIILERGYQKFDPPLGAAMIKVKGVAYTDDNNNVVVWDEHDVVIPALEPNAVFLTTNVVQTAQQMRGVCPDITTTCDCQIDEITNHGIATGNCSNGVNCDVMAWCPVENDNIPPVILQRVDLFTVFIRSNVEFQSFDVNVDNVQKGGDSLTPGYNLFTVEEILQAAGTSYSEVAVDGAMILGIIDWDCNFDDPVNDCEPSFEFLRLDDPNNSLSSGFNYRYVEYSRTANDELQRDLTKAYGIRLYVVEGGQGGEFDFITLTINLGAGLALLSIATITSDFIALYLLPQKQLYKEAKFEYIKMEDANNTPLLGNDRHHHEVLTN